MRREQRQQRDRRPSEITSISLLAQRSDSDALCLSRLCCTPAKPGHCQQTSRKKEVNVIQRDRETKHPSCHGNYPWIWNISLVKALFYLPSKGFVGASSVGSPDGYVGSAVVGAAVVGASPDGYVGSAVVDAAVVGASPDGSLGSAVVGASLDGYVGSAVVGAAVVGASPDGAVGSAVVGASPDGSVGSAVVGPSPDGYVGSAVVGAAVVGVSVCSVVVSSVDVAVVSSAG